MSELVKHEPSSALAIRSDQQTFTPQQTAALAQLGVEDASDGDLAVFFHQCQRTGLDPFLRQIYMVGRKSKGKMKYTIQTGIDGLRIVAIRSGEYAGQTEPEWCGEDGVWRTIWLRKWGVPAAARIGVYRKGFASPVYGVAMFDEYAQTTYEGGLTQMWAEKGALMIVKCAEALALRKAFPQDLSGIYTAEEMSQADNPTPQAAPRNTTPAPVQVLRGAAQKEALELLDGDVDALKALWAEAGLNDEKVLTKEQHDMLLFVVSGYVKPSSDNDTVDAEVVEGAPAEDAKPDPWDAALSAETTEAGAK